MEVINKYFDFLENNISDYPAQIFDCNETGLPLDHIPKFVVAVRGQKHPRVVTSGNKWHI